MLGNIGNLFCKMYETSHKMQFVPSVRGMGLLCNVKADRGPSQYCETSAKVTKKVTDPFRWFCELL